VAHQVAEEDGDKEPANGSHRDHEAICGCDVMVLSLTDPGGNREPGGEPQDEEEPDPDPDRPTRLPLA